MGRRAKDKALVSWVVVLGDFGRSPRMQYHTESLSKKPNSSVEVIAYGGSAPLPSLTSAPNVHIHKIPEPPAWSKKLPRLLFLVTKVLQQLFWMTWLMLFTLPRPQNILMQNPPAIPTMLLCWMASMRHGAKLVIDWHNFGYTIMALTYGASHWLVRIAKAYEKFWGRRGSAHFCVTKAMQKELHDSWGVQAEVLYDRPPSFFQRSDVTTVHKLFTKLAPSIHDSSFNDFASQPAGSGNSTLLTGLNLGQAQPAWRADRPAVVVSSTSWTPDEDFGVLLEAVVQYDKAAQQDSELPNVLLLITGGTCA